MAFATGSFWNDIGVSEEKGKATIFDNIKYGYLSVPMNLEIPTLKALDIGKRSAIVNALEDYIKYYVYSEEFKNQYLAITPLEPERPAKPEINNFTVQTFDQPITSSSEQIALMETLLNNPGIPEESRNEIRKAIEELKKVEMPSEEDIASIQIAAKEQSKKEYEEALVKYDADMIEYEKDMHTYDSLLSENKNFNPNKLMKNRLNEFLQLT
jgi:hypothetical protein